MSWLSLPSAEWRFDSLADLVDRVRPAPPELNALILAGAFDWTSRSRPGLLLEARAGERAWRRSPTRAAPALVASDGSALAIAAPPVAVPELPEFDASERVRAEFQSTGLWFSAHPLEVWLDDAAARGRVWLGAAGRVGWRVTVASPRRGVTTKMGEPMLFLTLADRSGLAECVLFPDAYRTWASATRGAILRVEGRVDETLDAVTVTAERIRSLVP